MDMIWMIVGYFRNKNQIQTMYSLPSSPRNVLWDVSNQEEDRAKNNLYEIGLFQDMRYLETFYKKQTPTKPKDSLEKWGVIQDNYKYHTYSNASKTKKALTQRNQNQLDPEPLPNLRKRRSNSQENFKKKLLQKLDQYQRHAIVSVNQVLDHPQPPKQSEPLKQTSKSRKRVSKTPIVSSEFPTTPVSIFSRRESQVYSSLRSSFKQQRSMSGALNIIKKQTQSIEKENKKLILSSGVNQKKAHKLRSEWMKLQKYPSLKQKDKMDLVCIDFCINS